MRYFKLLIILYAGLAIVAFFAEPPTGYTNENLLALLVSIGWPTTAAAVFVATLFPAKPMSIIESKIIVKSVKPTVVAKPVVVNKPASSLPIIPFPATVKATGEVIKSKDFVDDLSKI